MYECYSMEESASVRMTDAHMMYECHSVEGSASVKILRCAQDDQTASRMTGALDDRGQDDMSAGPYRYQTVRPLWPSSQGLS